MMNLRVFFLRVLRVLAAGLASCTLVHGDERARSAREVPVQTREAIDLDDRLYAEMNDYLGRYREFRRSLRSRFPRGEDRVAALGKWERDHKVWKADWERRKRRLGRIWDWGPGGRPGAPGPEADVSTASGRVAAAIRRIRREQRGTGRVAGEISRWMEENKALADRAELERAVPPAPAGITPAGLGPEEKDYFLAREKLQRIRKRLVAEGGARALKLAMGNPGSAYSRQKKITNGKHPEVRQKARPSAPEPNTDNTNP